MIGGRPVASEGGASWAMASEITCLGATGPKPRGRAALPSLGEMMSEASEVGEQDPPRSEAVRAELIEAGVLLASELSLPALLRRLVEFAVRITGARYGALGVTGPQGVITEFITVGLTDQERAAVGPIPSGRGILGALINDPRPLRLEKIQDDPRSVGFPPGHPPMTTFLGSPVRARGRVFGNLYLTEKEGGVQFDPTDQMVVETLATQAGVAIANAQTYRDLEQRERWLQATHQITAALLDGEAHLELSATIAAGARQVSGADLAAIIVSVERGAGRSVAAAAEGTGAEALITPRLSPLEPLVGAVRASGQSLVAAIGSGDPLTAPLLASGVPPGVLMAVPAVVRDQVEAVIVVARSAPKPAFVEADQSLLESFAAQAALALDYARVQAQSRQLAVVEERHRIARDLHDEPVQALIYLARRLELMAAEVGTTWAAATQLEETRELAVAVSDGLRQLTEGLRSEVLEREGLPAALEDLAQRFGRRAGLLVGTHISGLRARWAPEVERSLLRVAQEALSNIDRHAQAGRVRVDFKAEPSRLRLRVADDGLGFTVAGPGAPIQGLGTMGMRERMERLGGDLTIRSRPGRGTLVLARVAAVPLPGPEQARGSA